MYDSDRAATEEDHPRAKSNEIAHPRLTHPRLTPMAANNEHPRAQSNYPRLSNNYPRLGYPYSLYYPAALQNADLATGQEVIIQNCGLAGNIVQAALGILEVLFPNRVRVEIDCDVEGNGECTSVNVEAPVGTTQTSVDVCARRGMLIKMYCNSLYLYLSLSLSLFVWCVLNYH